MWRLLEDSLEHPSLEKVKAWFDKFVPKYKDGIINFYSDSDAFISKGMVTILTDIYGNNTPHDILNSDFELLKTLELDTLLTPGRRNGVYAMLKKVNEYAQLFAK